MGGPGSGRRNAPRNGGKFARADERPPFPVGYSRVELEPVMARDVAVGNLAEAEAIREELAGRVWQGVNPYAP